MLSAQKGDHLFCMDDADETLFVIKHRKRTQVVFVEEFSHFFAVGIDVTSNEVTVRQIGQWGLSGGEQELYERDKSDDPFLFIEQIDVGDGLDVAFELS